MWAPAPYGLYLPELGRSTWLRFVDGRPVGAITTQFHSWSCQKLEELGKKALVLVWDNASSRQSTRYSCPDGTARYDRRDERATLEAASHFHVSHFGD